MMHPTRLIPRLKPTIIEDRVFLRGSRIVESGRSKRVRERERESDTNHPANSDQISSYSEYDVLIVAQESDGTSSHSRADLPTVSTISTALS